VYQDCCNLPLAQAAQQLPAGAVFATLLKRGTLEIEFYKPLVVDAQQPHAKDEIYVIAAGSGEFTCGTRTFEVRTGDCLFVPAGVEHRFTRFSDDFATWAIFYGPDGGEQL
jgi:mannose-6-phosphate isomerase-like protein (cupin superfamily)